MGFIQRALFTWFVTLAFLILLCLRLESRIQWSFFIIFIPIWIYDVILIIWLILELIKRHQHHRVIDSFKKYQFYIYGVLLKICSQISICLKLDYNLFKLYIMMIPIWLLLIQLIIYVSLNLLPKHPPSSRSHQNRAMIPTASTSIAS
ncbi:CLUMA_CG019520, isoform A [Clunio marinus]|uniref:CLUMA_CG019520, isoform A n=1 Tax=Clunio marinus TaxID=568069 RepID=A0A1J1J2K7_9DIPT|nr:CLUMA_CG019520, isoform A [Clunio marinus]